MEQQGLRFKRVDADESEMIRRALPFINKCVNK
jgi:sporulation-control protein spo0M